jgi:hypothetical protein
MFYDIYLYTLCYYICCLLGACMRCTRLCSLKPGVTHGGSSGAHIGGLGAPNLYTENMDPLVGVPAAGLRIATPLSSRVGNQASITDRSLGLSQSGRMPWGCQGFRDKGLTSDPLHQNFQLLPE